MPERLWITGGQVLDRSGTRYADILISNGAIERVSSGDEALDLADEAASVIDVKGCLVTPGLVDMHVHLREPGGERAETIRSGCRAAAAGGFTTICAMANTNPVADTPAVIRLVQQEAELVGYCRVIPAGAITVGLAGERLSPMAELAAGGVRLFSDDGRCLQSAELMRRALEYAGQLDCVISNHAEDACLVCADGGSAGEREGVMNEGIESARLGLPGRPWAAEAVIVERDLTLAEMTGARIHIPHVSTAAAVDAIAAAKAKGVRVTAEVTPHHLTLTDSACREYDPVFRVNPPLRTVSDVEALRSGLIDGVIDVIASDHAPHAEEEKERAFEDAPPGMIGLETALAVVLTELVEPGHLSLEAAIGALSWNPAGILGVGETGGLITEGVPADLAVVDLAEEWVPEPDSLQSRSRNSPFAGKQLKGRVRHTVRGGVLVYSDGSFPGEHA